MPKWESKEETAEKALERRAREGLKSTLKTMYNWDVVPKEYSDRLESELKLIIQMGFTGYFLILSDLMKYLDEHKVPRGPGRGSAAGSLVVMSLGITKVDPIKYSLFFERFLNPSRVSLPDVDNDASSDCKDIILQYFVDKFGADHVAQIGTFTKFKTKSAIRDVCRNDGVSSDKTNKILALIPEEKRGGQGDNAVTFEIVLA